MNMFRNLNKQHIVMNVEFVIDIIVIGALGYFGDNLGFGLKLFCVRLPSFSTFAHFLVYAAYCH